jgi:hypothetical protein
VRSVGSGNFFGEIAVLTRQPRTATVQCIEDSTLIRFEREPVLEILRDYPKVKEIIGGVGLLRSEANLQDALHDGGGLADALEAPEDPLDEEPFDEESLDEEPLDEEPLDEESLDEESLDGESELFADDESGNGETGAGDR